MVVRGLLEDLACAPGEVSRLAVMILYCRMCQTGYGSVGEWPRTCPSCERVTIWVTSPPHSWKDDTDGWTPSENDRRMLRAFHIAPE